MSVSDSGCAVFSRLRGSVTDRFGVMWQVTPAHIFELLSDPEHGPRVFAAMVRMVKLDIAALEAA